MSNYLHFEKPYKYHGMLIIFNYLASHIIPSRIIKQKLKFFSKVKHYYWEEEILYEHCTNQVIRICVSEEEMRSILCHCHSLQCGGHFGGSRTGAKMLQCRFFWSTLFKDAHDFAKACDRCQ